MGYKPNEDNSRLIWNRKEVTFDKEAFIRAVFDEEYILVIGSKVIMNGSVEPSGDVNTYILNCLNRTSGEQYSDFNDVIEHAGERVDPIRNLINSDVHFSYDLADISPELCRLLRTRLFPIVLTTTIDRYLETLMRDIWGERLRVVSMDDSSLLDWRQALIASREKNPYWNPTLFYIFGKADCKFCVRTDDEALQMVEKWIREKPEDSVFEFIRSKKALALGCQFENWYFRIFWYVLKHEIKRFSEGEVAMEIDIGDRSDLRLKDYMDRKGIYNHGDARQFMNVITEDLTSLSPGNPFCELVLKYRRKGGIFISYFNGDEKVAEQLFVRLCNKGYRVWFDNDKLYGGAPYKKHIPEAIKDAPVFISLLSPAIASHLLSGDDNHYYRKEWNWAAEQPGKNIIPVAIDGYDIRSGIHKSFEQIMRRQDTGISGIDLAAPDGFNRLTESLDEYLTRL